MKNLYRSLPSLLVLLILFLIPFRKSPLSLNPMRITVADDGRLLTPITIQGKTYPIAVDLGWVGELSLPPKILAGLEKKRFGIATIHYASGQESENVVYTLKQIALGGKAFHDVWVLMQGKAQGEKGTIGRELFKKTHPLIDLKKGWILNCSDHKLLKRFGYDIKKWTPVPFEHGTYGVIFQVDTDLGPIRLWLSTEDPASDLNAALVALPAPEKEGDATIHTTRFYLGGQDFGAHDFKLVHLSPEPQEADGCIGSDFFRHHPIYIDYDAQILYVGH